MYKVNIKHTVIAKMVSAFTYSMNCHRNQAADVQHKNCKTVQGIKNPRKDIILQMHKIHNVELQSSLFYIPDHLNSVMKITNS